MKRREFNKYLNSCRRKKGLDPGQLATLSEEIRTAMVLFIVRNRAPILVELLTPAVDRAWLHSCGYLYETTGPKTGLRFIHTCEHVIR